MKSLISQLYSESEIPIIQSFAKDEDTKEAIYNAIGEKLIYSRNFVNENSMNSLLLMLSQSHFDEESVSAVMVCLWSCLKSQDIFPSLQLHRNAAFYTRCLTSLALFRKGMEYKTKYHGAPNINYYRRISQTYMQQDNLINLAKFHQRWEQYIFEIFK